jgi:hypothetical protein
MLMVRNQHEQECFLSRSGVYRMLLQRVWQTTYNRIFRVRIIIVRIYCHAYNLISRWRTVCCISLILLLQTFKVSTHITYVSDLWSIYLFVYGLLNSAFSCS